MLDTPRNLNDSNLKSESQIETTEIKIIHLIHLCGTNHGDPEYYVFVNEAVEVLVEEEKARPDEGSIWEVQLTLGHVGDLQMRNTRGRIKSTLRCVRERPKPVKPVKIGKLIIPQACWRSSR